MSVSSVYKSEVDLHLASILHLLARCWLEWLVPAEMSVILARVLSVVRTATGQPG